jgi:hypothetical protein
MPSPSADDRAPNNGSLADSDDVARSMTDQEPRSRTGKFLQGVFGRKFVPTPEPLAANKSVPRPPQEFLQVVPEPSNWNDGEDSNWDDDFMYEPVAKVPPVAVEGTLPVDAVAAPPPQVAMAAPPPPPSAMSPQSVVDEVLPPMAENQTISVNIPRPKNIKYKTKDPQASVAPAAVVSPLDKAEPIEFNVKRPTTIKYKTPPVTQPSWLEKILAPGRELWRKVQGVGDVIPTQLTENPQKILGILAAVLLSIVTSWAVVNFWPSSSVGVVETPAITSAATPPTSPEETLLTAVRSQFSTLASQYPAGLVSNLELDNEQQLAIVTLGNLWASLTGDQQQQVAQSLWQQARTYQMAKLEMRSGGGNLLARSPVVGQDMVIVSSY